ncbi:hypothetical protein PENTCL1PPCAC_12241, partial [Pristionchus entomophagus]
VCFRFGEAFDSIGEVCGDQEYWSSLKIPTIFRIEKALRSAGFSQVYYNCQGPHRQIRNEIGWWKRDPRRYLILQQTGTTQ